MYGDYTIYEIPGMTEGNLRYHFKKRTDGVIYVCHKNDNIIMKNRAGNISVYRQVEEK